MASTHLAGVFLTISTYSGPQLVYHYYDPRVAEEFVDDQDVRGDDDIVWSDESSDEEEGSSLLDSPVLSNSGARSLAATSRLSSPMRQTSRGPPQKGEASSASHSSMRSVAFSDRENKGNNTKGNTETRIRGASISSRYDGHKDVPSVSRQENVASPPAIVFGQNTLSAQSAGTSSSSNGQSLGSLLPPEDTGDSASVTSSHTAQIEERTAGLPCGFDKDIVAEILTPPESMCNEKFSLSVEECVFVGIPVHILDSGTWRPLKKGYEEDAAAASSPVDSTPLSTTPLASPIHSRSGSRANSRPSSRQGHRSNFQSLSRPGSRATSPMMTSHSGSRAVSPAHSPRDSNKLSPVSPGMFPVGSSTPVSPTTEAVLPLCSPPAAPAPELLETPVLPPPTGDKHIKGVVTEDASPMRMFHVCFVLAPPITEAAACEERIYQNILAPFVRMLRQDQASKNYVWEEVAAMQRAAEASAHLSADAQQEAIEAASELARALRIICTAVSNMEIARITICNKARALQVPRQLELAKLPEWLDEVPPHAYLSTSNATNKVIGHGYYDCYGLLLLGDPEDIVREIDVDAQGPVALMIRNIDPMSSLQDLANRNGIEIKQIVQLVWSLVYWRRARIIIPLHTRHTYGVSPLSPVDKLPQLAKTYHAMFPMIPPLQRFLSLLSSGKPKPFAMHVPSNDHRHIYLRALIWTIQNDLVLHLPTFVKVVVTRRIKLSSVNNDEETEAEPATEIIATIAGSDDNSDSALAEKDHVLLPPVIPHRGSMLGLDNETLAEQLRRRQLLHRRTSSHGGGIDETQDSVILDPRSATVLEKRWLAQVAVSGVTRNPDLAAMFQRLVKYFNGTDCLEQVMVYEKISREDMRKFLQEFNPYIILYRHW